MSDNKPSLEQALSALTNALNYREKYLDDREEELKKAEERFKVDKVCFLMVILVLVMSFTFQYWRYKKQLSLEELWRPFLTACWQHNFQDGGMIASKKDKDVNFLTDQEYFVFHPCAEVSDVEKYPYDSPNASDGRER